MSILGSLASCMLAPWHAASTSTREPARPLGSQHTTMHASTFAMLELAHPPGSLHAIVIEGNEWVGLNTCKRKISESFVILDKYRSEKINVRVSAATKEAEAR